MKNKFADYETSKMLKEIGFDEECLGTYLTDKSVKEGKLYPAEKDCDVTPQYDKDGYENFIVIKNSDCKDVPQYLSAPLWQQVKEWLWKENEIEIVTHNQDNDKRNRFTVSFEDDIVYEVSEEEYKSPIEAEIEGIKKAVDYLWKENQI